MAARPVADPRERMQISLNPDGSIKSRPVFPSALPNPVYDPNNPTSVLSKDITFDPSNDRAVFRMYLPCQQQPNTGAKLPVVFYFHGGGFLVCSLDSPPIFHAFCSDMAANLPALVVSLEYRLAPEHRLPAAYHDGMQALNWIKTNSADIDWLRDHADLSNCFLVGTSSGGNLAYNVGLRAAAEAASLEPMKIRGLVLHHPMFGGVERTPTELRLEVPGLSDLTWELALPVGADRDHEYSNPTAGGGSSDVDKMRALGMKVLVTGYEEDYLYDYQMAATKMLEKRGVKVETMFKEGGEHGLELVNPSEAKQLHAVIKKFITGTDS